MSIYFKREYYKISQRLLDLIYGNHQGSLELLVTDNHGQVAELIIFEFKKTRVEIGQDDIKGLLGHFL